MLHVRDSASSMEATLDAMDREVEQKRKLFFEQRVRVHAEWVQKARTQIEEAIANGIFPEPGDFGPSEAHRKSMVGSSPSSPNAV
jgi:hypothetical protein